MSDPSPEDRRISLPLAQPQAQLPKARKGLWLQRNPPPQAGAATDNQQSASSVYSSYNYQPYEPRSASDRHPQQSQQSTQQGGHHHSPHNNISPTVPQGAAVDTHDRLPRNHPDFGIPPPHLAPGPVAGTGAGAVGIVGAALGAGPGGPGQVGSSSSGSTATTSNMALPPFSSTFYTAPHYSSATSASGHPQQSPSMHAHSIYQPHHIPMGPPSGSYPPLPLLGSLPQQLSANPRAPPPHAYAESSRPPVPFTTSPGMHHLSPTTSPTMHIGPPGLTPRSASTPSFPSGSGKLALAPLPPTSSSTQGRRSGSTSQSNENESWDEGDSFGIHMGGMGAMKIGEETEEQPWGMPQDQYKALNPRDKKQVRNRIGARRFRAKRKDYVATLEAEAQVSKERLANCHAQIHACRAEINDLRARLGMVPLPEFDLAEINALGLRKGSGPNG